MLFPAKYPSAGMQTTTVNVPQPAHLRPDSRTSTAAALRVHGHQFSSMKQVYLPELRLTSRPKRTQLAIRVGTSLFSAVSSRIRSTPSRRGTPDFREIGQHQRKEGRRRQCPIRKRGRPRQRQGTRLVRSRRRSRHSRQVAGKGFRSQRYHNNFKRPA